MYAFHVDAPAGAQQIEVSMDTTTFSDSAGSTGAATSSNVLDLNWNQVVLYPQNADSNDVQFAASVHLPSGWKFGTALPVARTSGDTVDFSPVSLTTLVDSPLIAGSHYRKFELTDVTRRSFSCDRHSERKRTLASPCQTLILQHIAHSCVRPAHFLAHVITFNIIFSTH